MKSLKIGNTVYLEEEKEYVVITRNKKDDDKYVCLVATEKPHKIKFAKEIRKDDDIELEIVHNQKIKLELLDIFKDNISKLNF